MSHFLGSHKPWYLINRWRYRNTYAPNNHQSQHLNPVDYDGLVDDWLDVYGKVVGPMELLEWMSLQPELNVPKYPLQCDYTAEQLRTANV